MLETYLNEETLVAPQFFRESIPAHTTYRIKGIRSTDPALLKPVSWDLALLTHFVDTSRKAGYKEAHVLHSSAITMPITTGSEENAGRRLEKRYDHNAEHLGFTYNPKIKRYVLTL